MLIINLFGAPGAGKSTGAAYVFSQLKAAGINAELVTEFAKDKVWEETKAVFENQAYIFGKQYFRISRLVGKVDVAITDSPILLSAFYGKNDQVLGKEFNDLTLKVFNHYDSVNVYVHRVKPYNGAGASRLKLRATNSVRICCGFWKPTTLTAAISMGTSLGMTHW